MSFVRVYVPIQFLVLWTAILALTINCGEPPKPGNHPTTTTPHRDSTSSPTPSVKPQLGQPTRSTTTQPVKSVEKTGIAPAVSSNSLGSEVTNPSNSHPPASPASRRVSPAANNIHSDPRAQPAPSGSQISRPDPSISTSSSGGSVNSGAPGSRSTNGGHGGPALADITEPLHAHLEKTKAEHIPGFSMGPVQQGQQLRLKEYLRYRDAKDSQKNIHRAHNGPGTRPDPRDPKVNLISDPKKPYDPMHPMTKLLVRNKTNYHMARNDRKSDEAKKARGERPARTDYSNAKKVMDARDEVHRLKRELRDGEPREAPKKKQTKARQEDKLDNVQLEKLRLSLAKKGMKIPSDTKFSMGLGDRPFEEHRQFATGKDLETLDRLQAKSRKRADDLRAKRDVRNAKKQKKDEAEREAVREKRRVLATQREADRRLEGHAAAHGMPGWPPPHNLPEHRPTFLDELGHPVSLPLQREGPGTPPSGPHPPRSGDPLALPPFHRHPSPPELVSRESLAPTIKDINRPPPAMIPTPEGPPQRRRGVGGMGLMGRSAAQAPRDGLVSFEGPPPRQTGEETDGGSNTGGRRAWSPGVDPWAEERRRKGGGGG